MEKTIFEEMGGTYTQVRDYLLPDLKLPEEEQRSIGVWGQKYKQYFKQNRHVLYYNFLMSGKLTVHLSYIEEQASNMVSRPVKEYADRQGAEQLV